jgi:hypothetical protein
MIVKIRITADDKEQAQQARALLQTRLGANLRLEAPREGRNPRYEGNQKWFCYGDLTLEEPTDQTTTPC